MTLPHRYGQPPYRNGLINQAGNKRRLSDDLPDFASQYIPTFKADTQWRPAPKHEPEWTVYRDQLWKYLQALALHATTFRLRNILDIRLGLIIIWALVLWWGEEHLFRSKVEDCAWDRWESWSAEATPHHLVFITDPQLVDAHTYPGRPWPLSTLTIKYTDLYIRKSFKLIRDSLIPDSVLLLGDLFDGGREWSTLPGGEGTKSPIKRWNKYGQKYWYKEYRRWGRIFSDTWLPWRDGSRTHQRGSKFIAEVPGNHDLGFGAGVRIPARERFNAYFGEGNRIDVIGNHTFVSVDTVSLSAKGLEKVENGAEIKEIWSPTDQFLHQAQATRARAIQRELRVQNNQLENDLLDHTVYETDERGAQKLPSQPHIDTDIPSILLTHVPLYRNEGVSCGPLRERYPPSSAIAPGSKDERNALQIAAGYQYQNVLTSALSEEIVDLVGNVTHVFSGDDHDYCDMVHREFTSKTGGGVREITVKSISWAMGVRKPGFLLVSLWNPVDENGKAVVGPTTRGAKDRKSDSTLQIHLCLLPDQLAIFIRYAQLLFLTLLTLFIHAFRKSRCYPDSNTSYIASASGQALSKRKDTPTQTPKSRSINNNNNNNNQTSSSSSSSDATFASRANIGRSRSASMANGYASESQGGRGGWNEIDSPSSPSDDPHFKATASSSAVGMNIRPPPPLGDRLRRTGVEMRRSLGVVGGVVGGWYFYLLWIS